MPSDPPPRSHLLVLLAIGLVLLFFVHGMQPRAFPMDDAYIHFLYAQHLADGHGLTFNLSPPDTGLGTTSCLYVLLLAGLHRLGIPFSLAALKLGCLSYLIALLCVYRLAHALLARTLSERASAWALGTGALTAASGNLLWFTLSGMETMLFLALGLVSLELYRLRRFEWLGLTLGLLALTRMEGVALAGVIGLVELVAERRVRREMVLMAALVALCALPWLIYVHQRTGHWMPTTFAGKRLAHNAVIDSMAAQQGMVAEILNRSGLLFATMWLAYLGMFVYGGAFLPGPRLRSGELLKQFGGISLAGLLVFAGIILPLLALAGIRLAHALRRPPPASPLRRIVFAFLGWLLVHNAAYIALLPNLGTGSRYQAINHIAVILALGLVLAEISQTRWGRLATVTVAMVAVFNLAYWGAAYRSTADHMEQVRFPSARYLARELPSDVPLAVHDIGAIGYLAPQPIVDLGGLIDPSFIQEELAARRDPLRIAEYLRRRGVTYVILPGSHSRDPRPPLLNLRRFLHLEDTEQFRLVEVQRFENDFDWWQVGNRPIWNAQAAVVVYRLEWRSDKEVGAQS